MLSKVLLFIDKAIVCFMLLLMMAWNFGLYKTPFITFVVLLSIMGAIKSFMVLVLLIMDLSNFIKSKGLDKLD